MWIFKSTTCSRFIFYVMRQLTYTLVSNTFDILAALKKLIIKKGCCKFVNYNYTQLQLYACVCIYLMPLHTTITHKERSNHNHLYQLQKLTWMALSFFPSHFLYTSGSPSPATRVRPLIIRRVFRSNSITQTLDRSITSNSANYHPQILEHNYVQSLTSNYLVYTNFNFFSFSFSCFLGRFLVSDAWLL